MAASATGRLLATPPIVRLREVRLHAVTEAECVQQVLDALDAGRGGWIVTHNLDHFRRLRSDACFAALCADASLAVADGMPLVWACRLQGTPVPERVAGSNLVSSLTAGLATGGRSVFLLGGAPGASEAAAAVLHARHPDLRVAGMHCPPYGFEHDDTAIAAIERALVDAGPDVVYVALGSPKQEELIHRLQQVLPHAWWIGVGISLSFLGGQVRRAPRWMQSAGLEWVHRLGQEPGRLAGRYLVHGVPHALGLLASSAWRGMKARSTAGTDA